jgi:hypothetical protein
MRALKQASPRAHQTAGSAIVVLPGRPHDWERVRIASEVVHEQVDLRRRARDVRVDVEIGDSVLGEDVLA